MDLCEWGGKIIFARGKNNSRGVVILFKYFVKFEIATISVDREGRFMLVEVKIKNKTFVIRSVYAPVIDEPKFFDFLFSTIADFTDNDLVLGGV